MIYRTLINEELLISVETFTHENRNWINKVLNIVNYVKTNSIKSYSIEGGYKNMTLFTEFDIYQNKILQAFNYIQKLLIRLYGVKILNTFVRERKKYKEYTNMITNYSENGRKGYFFGNYDYDKLLENMIYIEKVDLKTTEGKETVKKCIEYFNKERDYIEREILTQLIDLQNKIIDLDRTNDNCLLSIVVSEQCYSIEKIKKAIDKIIELNKKEFNERAYILNFKKYFNTTYYEITKPEL